MTGLEKIIEKIDTDSEKDCASVIAAAYEKAKKLESDAEAERKQMTRDILDGAAERAGEIAERGEASAQQIKRQTLLKAKIEIVNEVMETALSEIKSLGEKEYFDILLKLAVSNARKGSGVMLLSSKDIGQAPTGFINNVISQLPSGYEITISDKPADIDGGFILVYGDIDVNCTFEALVGERRDELKERVCSIIFD